MTPAGFPHSDTSGSKSARDSPEIFAACHVLLRLLAPRHPLRALCSLTPPAPDQVVSRGWVSGLILDKTRRNRSSSITAETRIQLLRCDPPRWISRAGSSARSSSDPLVGDLGEGTDQGIGLGRTQNDGSRAVLRAVKIDSEWNLEQSSRGSTRALQFCWDAALRSPDFLRCPMFSMERWWRRGDSNS